MSLIVLNVSLPVIIKQPVCLYSEVSQHGVHSGGKTNTRHRISRQNWSRGQMRTRDRLSPGRIMSPPRSQIWASWRWWVITNSRIVFITGRTLRQRLWREREGPRPGVPRNVQYMTDKIISDTDTIITTPGHEGRLSRYRSYPRLHSTPRHLNILKLSLYHEARL